MAAAAGHLKFAGRRRSTLTLDAGQSWFDCLSTTRWSSPLVSMKWMMSSGAVCKLSRSLNARTRINSRPSNAIRCMRKSSSVGDGGVTAHRVVLNALQPGRGRCCSRLAEEFAHAMPIGRAGICWSRCESRSRNEPRSRTARPPLAPSIHRRLHQRKASPGCTPSAFKILASGQKPVNADCSRLAPTKAVNHSQLGLCNMFRARLIRMTVPANARTARSIDMT